MYICILIASSSTDNNNINKLASRVHTYIQLSITCMCKVQAGRLSIVWKHMHACFPKSKLGSNTIQRCLLFFFIS